MLTIVTEQRRYCVTKTILCILLYVDGINCSYLWVIKNEGNPSFGRSKKVLNSVLNYVSLNSYIICNREHFEKKMVIFAMKFFFQNLAIFLMFFKLLFVLLWYFYRFLLRRFCQRKKNKVSALVEVEGWIVGTSLVILDCLIVVNHWNV